MKVYINARFLTQKITGVQQFAWEICRNLVPGKNEYILLAPQGVTQPMGLSHLGFLNIGSAKGYAWEQIELPRFLSKAGKPLLINFCNTAPLIYRNQFVTIHDLSFIHQPEWYSRSFAKVYKFLIPRIAKRAKLIITVSETIKKQIREILGIEESRIHVLYNGLSNAILNAGHVRTAKEPVVLTVSSINPRKNLAVLIDAFLKSGLDNYRLLIAGAQNDVFGETHFPVNDPRVKFLGYVSDDELIRLYRSAETFASLSLDEGFGIPVLEAGHFGCRLLLSDIPVYRELFENHASFTSEKDAEVAASALLDLSKSATPADRDDHDKKYSYAVSATLLAKLIEESF